METKDILRYRNENMDPWKNRRQTYYIPEVLIDALKLQKVFDNKDISEIVREALLEHLDPKYIKMAEENLNKKNSTHQ